MLNQTLIVMQLKTVCALVLGCCWAGVEAQQAGSGRGQRQRLWGVEAGGTYFTAEMADNKNIRNDNPLFYDGTMYADAYMYQWYAGVTREMMCRNNKFGLVTGLRFTRVTGTSENTEPGYYFYRLNSDGQTSNYLKVRELGGAASYVGVPLELCIRPYRERAINLYFKLGGSFNYLLGSEKKVTFVNPAMEAYGTDVEETMADAEAFYGYVFAAAGFRFGKGGEPRFSLELRIPSMALTPDVAGVKINEPGYGVHLIYQLPSKTTQP